MLLANPHRAWRGTERFWMAHLTVPGSYDVMGGTIGGFPPIGIGFNKGMAWSHTVSTARRFVVFQLKLAPGDPTSYLVDGKPQKMGTQTVAVGDRKHTFYKTRYGLVFNLPRRASRGPTTSPTRSPTSRPRTCVGRTSTRDGPGAQRRGLLKSMGRVLGIPTFNTIAADRSGRALYADSGRSPTRRRRRSTRAPPRARPGSCTRRRAS